LERPSPGSPSSPSEGRFPRFLGQRFHGDIRQIGITLGRVLIPAKHAVNGALQLGAVCFVDATGVDPHVPQTIGSGLLDTEPNLLIAGFILSSALSDVFVCDFILIVAPCMREDGVRWEVADQVPL